MPPSEHHRKLHFSPFSDPPHRFRGSILLASVIGFSAACAQSTVPVLPEYQVLGFDASSYGSQVSTTATRVEIPHDELPLSVNVVSEYLLEEQQAINPSDAFKNISNVEAKVASSGQDNQVAIRGFNSFTFIDGFRVGNSNSNGLGATSFAPEVANIERIEVLKGPAATLYGRGLPGGVINYITKKPQVETSASLTTQFGSESLFRTVADITGPIDQEHVFYRFIGSFSDQGSHRNEVEAEAVSLYPSLLWQFSPDASLLLRTEYQKVDFTPDQGALFLIDGSPAPASSESFFYGSPDDSIEAEQYGINAQFEAELTERYTLRVLAGYRQATQKGTSTLGTFVNGNILERVTEVTDDTREDFLFQMDHIVSLEHSMGPLPAVAHRLLLTADWQKNRITPTSAETPLDFFDITTGTSSGPSPFAGPPNDFDLTATDYGIGLQDIVSFGERLHLLLGIRYDVSELEFDLQPFPFAGDLSIEDWSYRAGLVYQLNDSLAVFTNYGTAFRPSFRINQFGQSLFDLQESIQYEVGIKVDLYEERLNLTASAYRLKNKDVVIADSLGVPVRSDQQSTGIELDLSARLSDRTTLLFNYAVTDTDYSSGPFSGNALSGTPRQSGGFWVTHDLISTSNRHFSLGLGLNYTGEFYATDANNVTLPDYLQLDAGMQYEWKNWRFRLNVFNLLNEEAFITSPNSDIGDPNAPIYALPVAPTNLRLSASYRF